MPNSLSSEVGGTPNIYIWSFPGCPIRVHLHLNVIERLNAEVSQIGPESENGCKETGGFLIGRYDGPVTEIIDFQPVPCEYSSGSQYALATPGDQIHFGQVLENSASAVGYYRTQTRGQNQLTDEDLSVIDQHFTAPGNVHLIVGPTDEGPSMAGVFFRDDGKVSPVSFMEFPCDPAILSSLRLPANITEQSVSPPQTSEQPRYLQPAPRTSQKPLYEKKTGKRLKFLIPASVLIVILLGASLAVLGYVFGRQAVEFSQNPIPSLSLVVRKQREDLRVSWDRSSALLRDATSGWLSIIDGNSPRQVIPLNAEELKTGFVLYTPATGNVQFQLEVTRVSESVLVVAPSATSSGPLSASSAAPPTQSTQPIPRAPNEERLTPVNFVGPRSVHKVEPELPREMRLLVRPGTTVLLKVAINDNGKVTRSEAVSGPGYLVAYARNALDRWTFEPATLNGKRVPSSTVLSFEFRPQP